MSKLFLKLSIESSARQSLKGSTFHPDPRATCIECSCTRRGVLSGPNHVVTFYRMS